MPGDHELRSLAHLLIISAETARAIAGIRPSDRNEINRLASLTEEIADQLVLLVGHEDGVTSAHH